MDTNQRFPYAITHVEQVNRLQERASQFLRDVHDLTTSPEYRKTMRTWGISDAAAMVGRSAQAIRNQEGPDGLLGEPPRDSNGRRAYTLEAINRIRDLLGTRYHRPEGSTPIILPVVNFKGGSTKSTTALHLAQKAAIDGLRVLLIDADPQASSSFVSGYTPDEELGNEDVINPALLDDPGAIHSVIQPTYVDGLYLIPGSLALQNAELELFGAPDASEHRRMGRTIDRLDNALAHFLATSDQEWDLVLIDCGPNLGPLTLNAIGAANSLLVPMPPEMPDFASSSMFLDTMSAIMERMKKELVWFRFLITRHPGSRDAQELERMIRRVYGDRVLPQHMVATVEMEKAYSNMATVYELSYPIGSRQAYNRAMTHLDDVNNAILSDFFEVWEHQAQAAAEDSETPPSASTAAQSQGA